MAEDAQRVPDDELRDFMVTLTHDLRTPLTLIRGFADVLIKGNSGLSEAERLDYLERVKAAAVKLDALITQMSTAAAGRRSR
jgi:signal transduction histidine kinase